MPTAMESEPSEGCRNPFTFWTCCCSNLLQWISFMFGKTGRWIAKHPWCVILVAHLLVLFFSCGFIFLKFEKNTEKLYNPQNSQAERDLNRASKHFLFKIRREMVILVPKIKHSRGVLTRECLMDALELHRAITGLENYHQLCIKATGSNQCVTVTPLEIFRYNPLLFSNITTKLTVAYRNKEFMMTNGRPAYYNFPAMFGKTLKPNPARATVERADALQMIYIMQDPTEDSMYKKVLEFEKNFLDVVSEVKNRLKFVDVFYTSSRSIDDAVNESTMSDVSLFSITFFAMILFACVASGNCLNPTRGHALLATSCVIAVGYGIVCGLGLGMWLGIPFISIVGVLPFLVLGVGLDDMFIIVNEFDRLPRGLSVVRCISTVMTNIGSSITMTTVTTLVAYLISTSTSFLAIRYFCLYAAFCIGFSYLFVVGFFVAALSIDARRIRGGRLDCLPCLSVKKPGGEYVKANGTEQLQKSSRSSFLFSDQAMKIWATFLLKRPTKVIVFLLMLAMIGGGVTAAMNIDQRFDRALLAKPDSYFQEFLTTFEKYYSESLKVDIVIDQNIPYKWWYTQKDLLKLSSIVKENKYYENATLSWIEAFKAWSKAKHLKSTGNDFLKSLKRFLSLPPFRHFNQDIVFSRNRTEIVASRILAFTKSTKDTMAMSNAMVSIRNDLKSKTKLPAYAVAKEFLSFEHYLQTSREAIRNLMFSSVAILVVTSVYLVHPAAILLVFVNFVCLVVELLGILHVWGIPLNTLAMVGFVMAVGYSVDYSAHVAHAYILSPKATADERVTHALATVGSSVFWGVIPRLLMVKEYHNVRYPGIELKTAYFHHPGCQKPCMIGSETDKVPGPYIWGAVYPPQPTSTDIIPSPKGFSTFLGVIVIAFSQSKLFQLLFRILFSIVVLGLLHGLVFLPVSLSLFCPWKLNVVGEENNNIQEDAKGIGSEEESDDEIEFIEYNHVDFRCPCDFCERYAGT